MRRTSNVRTCTSTRSNELLPYENFKIKVRYLGVLCVVLCIQILRKILHFKIKTHLHLPEFSSAPAWDLRGVLGGRYHQ